MMRGKLVSGLIVLFLAGALTGIVGASLYQRYEQEERWERGPAARQERIMNRLIQELALTPDQQTRIEPIVSRAHMDILQLRFQHQPEVEQILTQSLTDIKATLSAEQQAKQDQLYARLQRRWQTSREYLRTAQDRVKRPE